ncbi:MAG: TetR/AcrR family transcriptional regulator [Bacteriovoracaceae bacterium]
MAVRKDEIKQAALKILSEEGIFQFSLKRISEVSKISKSLISYHYKDSRLICYELFQEMGELGARTTDEAIFGAENPEEKLTGVVDGALKWIAFYPDYSSLIILMYHLSAVDEKILAANKLIHERGEKRIEDILCEAGVKKPKLLSRNVHNLIVGTLVKMVTMRESHNYQAYRKDLLRGINKITGLKLTLNKSWM